MPLNLSLSYQDTLRSVAILLLIFSFSLGELYRHLIVILAICGIYAWSRYFKPLNHEPATRLLIALFLCIWIPMLISLFDAGLITRSASVTARFLIFPLAGVIIMYWLLWPSMARILLWGTMGIMLFWTFDGLIQFSFGHDIFGHPAYISGRLTGTFANWPHLGVILAIFLPVYLEALYRLSQKSYWAWLLIIPVIAVILLGGSRSSWILTGVALIAYFICFQRAGRVFSWRRGFLLVVIAAFTVGAIIWNVDWLSQRVQNTMGLFSGDYTEIRQATSIRTPVWATALNMTTDHWFNGVGPRSFQSFYPQYTVMTDDPFIDQPAGHPHLFALEVSAETGLVGLAGYMIFFILLIRQFRNSLTLHHMDAIPWGIAGLVAAFPLSSTMSFYAYFSSSLMWTLIIIYIALDNPRGHSGPRFANNGGA